MNRRSFLSLAPLILMPEPRRAYSFLWERGYPPVGPNQESVRHALDRFMGKPLNYDVGSVARSIEQAVMAGGGQLWNAGPRVTIERDAFFLESKTARVRIEWR